MGVTCPCHRPADVVLIIRSRAETIEHRMCLEHVGAFISAGPADDPVSIELRRPPLDAEQPPEKGAVRDARCEAASGPLQTPALTDYPLLWLQ